MDFKELGSVLKERIPRWISTCAANTEIDNLKDALQQSEWAMHIAENWSDLHRSRPGLTQTFNRSREALGKIRSVVETAEGICLDIAAVARIHRAVKVLNQDDVIRKRPEQAAHAFGDLFAGFGRLAKHLPPPANEYAVILEHCGDFFLNMRRGIDSEVRWQKQFEESLKAERN